ncbi:hypothetical protein ABZ646_37900 [Streptomyces sp. NPDC007162]|uniref:hypothetical protein n=1 Tax=Streptomyces sp. NPDC007162 TaxID=3156917 RepID=UPI0033C41091
MSEQQQQSSWNEPLRVDTDLMRPAIPRLMSLAHRLRSAGEKLQNTSESLRGCEGGDKTGQKFDGQYQGPHHDVVTAALQGGAVLEDSTGQVADMVKAFEASEENAAATGNALRSQMNPG